MVPKFVMLFLALGIPCMAATITSHLDEGRMRVLDRNELAGILGRMAAPFTQLKNQRNIFLDQLFDGLMLHLNAFRTGDMQKVYEGIMDAAEQLPRYQNTSLPAAAQSVGKINATFARMEALFQRCESKPVMVGPALPLDLRPSSPISWLENVNVGDYIPKAEEEEEEEEEEDKSKLPTRIWPLSSALAEELKRPLVCDNECQAIAIGTGNSGSHIVIEDLASVFSQVLGKAMQEHLERYESYLLKIQEVQLKLFNFSSEVHILRKQVKVMNRVMAQVHTQAATLLRDFALGTGRLLGTLERLTC